MMKYVVTGAAGHLGTQIVKALAQLVAPQQMTLGVHTPAKAATFAAQGMTVLPLDYRDSDTVATSWMLPMWLFMFLARVTTVLAA